MRKYLLIASAALLLCLFAGNAMAGTINLAGTGTYTLGSWHGQGQLNGRNIWWKVDSDATGAILSFFSNSDFSGQFWHGFGGVLNFNNNGIGQGHFNLGSSTIWSFVNAFDFSCSSHSDNTVDVLLTAAIAPVPEPSAMLLLGAGLLGIGLLRRKFKS